MPNVLEVQIVGDVSALEKSLKQAEKLQAEYTSSIEKTSKELAENIAISRNYAKAIEELDKELKSGSISSKEYSSQLSKLKKDEQETKVATADLRKELANLKREQKDLGNGFQKDLTPKIANGGNTLMQFSRIAQDAPFGIIGIGNNITATVESFGHLSKSAGGAGAALKAVASSMLGSGGILLAVSLVTTGLTYMAQNGLSVKDVFDKMTGSFDANAKALSEVNAEAVKNSQAEISILNALTAVAKDETATRKERLAAVKKLQDEYPAYFGNLSREQILNGDVATAVKEVTTALIAKAKAAALSGKIAELAAEELLLREKETKAIERYKDALKSTNKATQQYQSSGGTLGATAVSNIGQLKQTESTLAGVQNQLRSNIATQRLYISGLQESIKEATAFDAANKKAGIKPKAGKTPKTPKATKEKADTFDSQKRLDELANIAFQMGEITSQPLFDTDKTEENLNKLKELSQEMAFTIADNFSIAQQAGQLFSDGVGSAVGALGSELAASLETGNAALDAFVGSVIQGFAEIAAAQLAGLIAKQTIAAASLTTDAAVSTGNAVVAATETASATGPAAAFVLPALVGAAIGFIAASFAGIKFAHGGVVPGGSFTGDKVPAMLNSGEIVMNRQQQANTLMAIGNGNANSLQNNVKSDNFILETALRGSDLLLAIKREEKKR